MIRRILLPLLAFFALGVAGAQSPEEVAAAEDALTMFQGGQVYCKVELFQGHETRLLCFGEKNLVYFDPIDISLATRVDLMPWFAITPMVQVSYTQEQWWLQSQIGRTVMGDGGFYFSFAAGFPLP